MLQLTLHKKLDKNYETFDTILSIIYTFVEEWLDTNNLRWKIRDSNKNGNSNRYKDLNKLSNFSIFQLSQNYASFFKLH